ncbi:MAG: hypothetical protein KGP28_04075 [Bdellovibrionales bacterium]|nr:hypothetical protein [Bdellovibrionales bacterium]
MLKLIGSVLKYSLLVLLILVLSHIVEIKGVTLSQHVLNGMGRVSGFTPSVKINQITDGYSRSLKTRLEQIRGIDPDVTPEDQKALDRVIEHSQASRKQ